MGAKAREWNGWAVFWSGRKYRCICKTRAKATALLRRVARGELMRIVATPVHRVRATKAERGAIPTVAFDDSTGSVG